MLWEKLKETAAEKPPVFAVIAIVIVSILVFWQVLQTVLKGLFYAAIALAIIFGTILLWVKVKYRQPSLKQLASKKKRLLTAIKIAETKYMKRRLSEKDFNKIFKEKQRKLIELEAILDQRYNKESEEKISKELLAVQTKKRHILKSLLGEKKRVIKELDIAERRYLKRKIDAKTYQDLVQKNQHKLIELEAHIKELYNEANVSKVMEKLKEKIAQLKKQKKTRKKKKKINQRQQQLQIAKEIAEQISFK